MTRWERFFYGAVAAALILTFAGCGAARTIYHACKGGYCS